jgi:archaellum component FlaG (FlaF/FlaG flagellin family)
MGDEPELPRPWWQTLPVALTAVAGVITAITGLIVAVDQLGILDDDERALSVEVATSAATGGNQTGTETALSGDPTGYRVAFPQGDTATFDDAVFEVIGSGVQEQNPGELVLAFMVRMTNNWFARDNFSGEDVRLLVDGVARAPTNDLFTRVDSNSSVKEEVIFALPPEGELHLRFLDRGETIDLPFEVHAGSD